MAFGGWGEDSEEGQSFALNEHQKKDLGLPLRPEDPELLKLCVGGGARRPPSPQMDSRSVTGPRWRPGTLGIEARAAHSLCLADCKRGPLAGPPTDLSLPSLARGLRAGSTRLYPTAPRAAPSPPWHPARIWRPPLPARSPRSSPRDSFSNGAESLFTSAAQGDSICVKSPNASADQ